MRKLNLLALLMLLSLNVMASDNKKLAEAFMTGYIKEAGAKGISLKLSETRKVLNDLTLIENTARLAMIDNESIKTGDIKELRKALDEDWQTVKDIISTLDKIADMPKLELKYNSRWLWDEIYVFDAIRNSDGVVLTKLACLIKCDGNIITYHKFIHDLKQHIKRLIETEPFEYLNQTK